MGTDDVDGAAVLGPGMELVPWCPHWSWSGAERPVLEMGRMPVLWQCDSCGIVSVSTGWSVIT